MIIFSSFEMLGMVGWVSETSLGVNNTSKNPLTSQEFTKIEKNEIFRKFQKTIHPAQNPPNEHLPADQTP